MTDDPRILVGSCLDRLKELPDSSVHAVVTDPPYGLSNTTPQQVADTMLRWASGEHDYVPAGKGFMGKSWDAFVPPPAVWIECMRVIKPGGHVLAFAGSRTGDLMSMSLRLAGFDIRDTITWHYASGFPKSLDVSKAIDKAAEAERTIVGSGRGRTGKAAQPNGSSFSDDSYQWPGTFPVTVPATDDAKRWAGWGTALKPSSEPIIVARKPLTGTVAATVLEHGTGALNIDATRVGSSGGGTSCSNRDGSGVCQGHPASNSSLGGGVMRHAAESSGGRWPANTVFTHAPGCANECVDGCPVAVLDEQGGTSRSRIGKPRGAGSGQGWGMTATGSEYDDQGGASRFFPTFRYQAKPSKRERNAGVPAGVTGHPTVKPVELMRWLIRLVTPEGGLVLDPFLGSGTTAVAAILEGKQWLGCEITPEYLPIIRGRVAWAEAQVKGDQAKAGQLELFEGDL